VRSIWRFFGALTESQEVAFRAVLASPSTREVIPLQDDDEGRDDDHGSIPPHGDYTRLGRSVVRDAARRIFFDHLNRLTEDRCFDDLLETCDPLLPESVGTEDDPTPEEMQTFQDGIQAWQARWHLAAVDPDKDDWIFGFAAGTVRGRYLQKWIGSQPDLSGRPVDEPWSPGPKAWLPEGHVVVEPLRYFSYPSFPVSLSESRRAVKLRLTADFERWLDRCLDAVENEVTQRLEQPEPKFVEREGGPTLAERLEWLARYQVLSESHLCIYERSGTLVTAVRVWRAIKQMGSLVGLLVR